MQHYIAIYVVSKEKSTRCRKSKHSLKLYNPTPRTVKVLLLDTSVYHTHASPVPELEVWKLLQSSLGGGGVLPFPGGRENPTRSPNRTHTGSWFRVRNGIEDSNGGKKHSSQNKRGWVGKDTKLTDTENHSERPNEKSNFGFPLEKIWGKWYPSL